jgi:hypothetical protein
MIGWRLDPASVLVLATTFYTVGAVVVLVTRVWYADLSFLIIVLQRESISRKIESKFDVGGGVLKATR